MSSKNIVGHPPLSIPAAEESSRRGEPSGPPEWLLVLKDGSLSTSQRLCLAVLKNYIGKKPAAWVSDATLAADLGLGLSTVRRILMELEDRGRIRRPWLKRAGGRRRRQIEAVKYPLPSQKREVSGLPEGTGLPLGSQKRELYPLESESCTLSEMRAVPSQIREVHQNILTEPSQGTVQGACPGTQAGNNHQKEWKEGEEGSLEGQEEGEEPESLEEWDEGTEEGRELVGSPLLQVEATPIEATPPVPAAPPAPDPAGDEAEVESTRREWDLDLEPITTALRSRRDQAMTDNPEARTLIWRWLREGCWPVAESLLLVDAARALTMLRKIAALGQQDAGLHESVYVAVREAAPVLLASAGSPTPAPPVTPVASAEDPKEPVAKPKHPVEVLAERLEPVAKELRARRDRALAEHPEVMDLLVLWVARPCWTAMECLLLVDPELAMSTLRQMEGSGEYEGYIDEGLYLLIDEAMPALLAEAEPTTAPAEAA